MVARPLKLESLGKPATEETASKQRSKRVADVANDFKLTALGQNIKGLSTSELIAILLSSSQVSVGQSVLQELSQTGQEPLEVLRDTNDKELMKVFGVGPAKAKIILAAVELGKRIFSPRLPEGAIIDSPAKAASAFSYDLMCQAQERFALLLLNVNNRLIGTQVITIGTATETLADPKDIFRVAIRQGATRLIVAHNHPSGSVEPSPEDLNLTRQLLAGAQLLNTPLLDHIILGNGEYLSLRQITELWSEYPQGD